METMKRIASSIRSAPSPPHRHFAPSRAATVVLTRQAASNGKAKEALLEYGVTAVELPLIEFRLRPEATYLRELLSRRRFDWVALTSPQAARVFVQAWRQADRPAVRVATFAASRASLPSDDALTVGFVPSTSNADTLALELPKRREALEDVLYPASSKADDLLERRLRRRHFVVTRLDTYDTVTVAPSRIDALDLSLALAADVLTFASPTAVAAWVEATGGRCDFEKAVACIGSTTAKRARDLGFKNVFFAAKPGLEGLVHSVVEHLRSRGKLPLT